MGTNFIQPGVDIKLATGTGLSANDPFLYGDFLPCVLMTDAETASPYYAVCRTSGVFDLSVNANNGSPAAVAVGDQIFYTADPTPKLDKAATGKPFGVALEAIGSGETATIQVRLNGFYFPDGAIATEDLADGAVTLEKLYAIAQGSIIVGGDANAPTALAAGTSGQILIGNGTDLKSVAVSGDVTIDATGVTTIGAGKVDQRQTDNTHTYETFNASPVVSQVS
ncbi:MAG: capsid cement protein, partial [Bacilli bacterium]